MLWPKKRENFVLFCMQLWICKSFEKKLNNCEVLMLYMTSYDLEEVLVQKMSTAFMKLAEQLSIQHINCINLLWQNKTKNQKTKNHILILEITQLFKMVFYVLKAMVLDVLLWVWRLHFTDNRNRDIFPWYCPSQQLQNGSGVCDHFSTSQDDKLCSENLNLGFDVSVKGNAPWSAIQA